MVSTRACIKADAQFDRCAVDREAKCAHVQEVGFCHMRINDGVVSRLQLAGLLAKMCRIAIKSSG